MPPSPLRIAVMGLGAVAADRHIPALMRQAELVLTGVIDRHEGRAAMVAQYYKLPHYAQTDSLESVAWLEDIDALVVCTPVAGRAKIVKAALAMGKHVLVEKPCALSVAEGESLNEAAARAGKILAVIHNFPFSRAGQRLEADLRINALGKLCHVEMSFKGSATKRLAPWIDKLPCGAFFNDSPHFFSLIRRLASGKLTLVGTTRQESSTPTPKAIHLAYCDETRVPFTFQGQYDSPLHEWFLIVSGEKGAGVWDLYRDIYIRLPSDDDHSALSSLKTSLYAILQHLWGYLPNGLAFLAGRLDYGSDEVIRRFTHSVRTQTPDDRIGWKEALAVLALQQEAIKAIEENKSA